MKAAVTATTLPAPATNLPTIHKHLAEGDQVRAIQLMMQDRRFPAFLRSNPKAVPAEPDARLQVIPFLYLMSHLYRRDYISAASLIWGPDVFTAEPAAVQRIWNAIGKHNLINVLGCASAGKTYSAGARFLLEWVLDPDNTLVRVMSVKEDHVIKNLFGDMQRLYSGSVIPLPGKADSSSIATPKGKLAGQGIFPIVIPRGPDAGGTIKGSKVKPRPKHPLFDTSSRTFLIVDEAQEVPESAYSEIPNLFSSIEESAENAAVSDTEHTVIVCAANPKDIHSRWGQNCVNQRLWDEIAKRVSSVKEWTSDRGWFCIRINALETENIIANRTIHKRFITPTGVRMKMQDVGGDAEHPLIWSEVYGMFPPLGMMWDIIQRHWVDRSRGEWLFESATTPVASEDPGLTGDPPAMAAGRIGRAVAWTDLAGQRHDLPAPRHVLQVDVVGLLPLLADSQLLADETMHRLRPLGVKPNLFGIDRTGVGQGTHDIIRHQWRDKVDGQRGATEVVDIMGVHYSEAASEVMIGEEDSKNPLELYGTVIGEMWYAAARFFEHDCIRLGRGVDEQTIGELVNRRGGSPGGKGKLKTVESKKDFKERNGGKSPDRADALTLLVHTARHNVAELRPRAPDTTLEVPRLPTIFDRMQGKTGSGLTFGHSLDLGWQSMTTRGPDQMKD